MSRPLRAPGASRSASIAGAWTLVSGLLAFATVSAWPLGAVLAWPALSLACVALAYARGDATLFRKGSDGSLPWRLVPQHWPYLGLMLLMTRIVRRVAREPACHAVLPALWLGRRPRAAELPAGTTLLVDLTAELAAPLAARVPSYVCLPTLDGTAPDVARFTEIVARIAAHEGGAYVHCAFGHGRSACVVAAVLVARGVASDVASAFAHIRGIRPLARLSQTQWQLLACWAARAAGALPAGAGAELGSEPNALPAPSRGT